MSAPRRPDAGWERWMFREYALPTASLGLYRILFALATLFLMLPQGQFIPGLPPSFFRPPVGFMLVFSGFPGRSFFWALNFTSMLCALFLLFGHRTRLASLGLGTCLLVGCAWTNAVSGKINHDILFVLVPFVLPFAGWGRAYALDARASEAVERRGAGWPLALLALLIALAMLTSAIAKVEGGWLDPATEAVRFHLARYHFWEMRPSLLGGALLGVRWHPLWKAMDLATVVLEAAFLPCVVRLRYFRIVCALAAVFHLAIALLFRIEFWSNVVAYGAFVDWAHVVPARHLAAVEARLEPLAQRLAPGYLVGAAGALAAGYLGLGNPPQRALAAVTDYPALLLGDAVCTLGAVIGMAFLAHELSTAGASEAISQPLVLFDGVCGICNRWVDFLLRVDRRGVFRFTPLQSPVGRATLERFGYPRGYLDSVLLLEDGQLYASSTAGLRTLRRLGAPFSLAYGLIVVPRFLRDALYRFGAANRYRWFGKRDVCRVPTPEERDRFV